MNVAVFLPNWIGDVVMATPALRALRRHFPSAHFTAVGRPYVAGVLDGSPWFDARFYLNRRGWSQGTARAAWALRRTGIDLAILFPNSFRSALVAWLGGCRRRVGFRRYGRGPLLTDALEPVRDRAGRLMPHPILLDYNRLARQAGCPEPGCRMELFTTAADEEAADRVWAKFQLESAREVICLNPGAAFGAAKFWPVESFAALARDLVEQRGSRVVVLCGPAERDLARGIAHLASVAGVATLADEPLSLGLTKAVIRRAALLVTTDSGPRHFAAAFQRPVVSLFGPTFIDWTRTYFPREVMLQKAVPCGPCQQRVCPTDHACMTTLSSVEVFLAVQNLLDHPALLSLPIMDPERKAS